MTERSIPNAEQHGQAEQHDASQHGAVVQHGSLKSYVTGFVLSIVLTIIPLLVVLNGWFERSTAVVVLLGTAALQFVVQLVYFMHLKEESKPRLNLMALILGLVIVLTVVIGSIFVMGNNQVAH